MTHQPTRFGALQRSNATVDDGVDVLTGQPNRIWEDGVAVLEVQGQDGVVSGEVGAWSWGEGGEPGEAVEGVEDDVSRPVVEWGFESVDDLPAVIDRNAALCSFARAERSRT